MKNAGFSLPINHADHMANKRRILAVVLSVVVCLPAHCFTVSATNSGPLSLRTCSGAPRCKISTSRNPTTSPAVIDRATCIPRHSRVNSSNTVSIFNPAPFSSRSWMKSYDQTWFGFCARVRSACGSRLRLVLRLFFTTCSSSRRRTRCTRFRFTRHPSARSNCVIIRYPWRACLWLNAWIRLSNRTVIRLTVPFR